MDILYVHLQLASHIDTLLGVIYNNACIHVCATTYSILHSLTHAHVGIGGGIGGALGALAPIKLWIAYWN